jgi:hypothetical protein
MYSVDYPATSNIEAMAYDGSGLTARESSPNQGLVSGKKRKDEEAIGSPATKKPRSNDAPPVQAQSHKLLERQSNGKKMGLPNRNLLEPSYKIDNALGPLSNRTILTDLVHHNGYTQYDTHNL